MHKTYGCIMLAHSPMALLTNILQNNIITGPSID